MNTRDGAPGFFRLPRLRGDLSRFLSRHHKRQLLLISLWAFVVSGFEALVAGAVIPYVACLSDRCPTPVLSIVELLGHPLIPTISLGLFLLIVMKLGVQGMFTWSSSQFNQQLQRDTVSRLLEGYLHMDWGSFRQESRTHYLRRCTSTAVDAATISSQCLALSSSGLTLVFLAGLMIWQYPFASLPLAVAFVALNFVTHRVLGAKQRAASHQREEALKHWNKGMSEAFASFREIRVYQLEAFFLRHSEHYVETLSQANVKLALYPSLPRLILDFAVLGTLLVVVSIWILLERPIRDLLPQLVFYAVVARSMLPAMMSFLASRASLIGAGINVKLVLDEMDRVAVSHLAKVGVAPEPAPVAAFRLERVVFAHGAEQPPVINGANLDIAHPSWLAVVGPSGAGKSTLMELLCGVVRPQSGFVRHLWPSIEAEDAKPPLVAYLPQHVALLEGSVLENVVFGFDAGDERRVDEALRLACLESVVGALAQGVHAPVGADGAHLSGGQRQRLALARALYRSPDLLLLDEATSGLDEATEARLLGGLKEQRPSMTVVYITHRSTNLRFADRTVSVGDGFIQEAQGATGELMRSE